MLIRNVLYLRLVTWKQQIFIGKSFSYKHGYKDTFNALKFIFNFKNTTETMQPLDTYHVFVYVRLGEREELMAMCFSAFEGRLFQA